MRHSVRHRRPLVRQAMVARRCAELRLRRPIQIRQGRVRHCRTQRPRKTWFRTLAARCARVVQPVYPPKTRGRRECRMRAAPAISCAVVEKEVHTSIQGSGEHPTFPAQWLYGLWRALLGESMLCCHRRRRDTSRQLDARLRASGPHVFAVRSRAVRYRRYQRPPRPVPTIVTIMIRPSGGTGWAKM